MEQEAIQCCVVSCERPLDATYWNNQYLSETTGWDLGEVSPPIKNYIDAIEDKNISILIPGCGNAYEAEYLSQKGFSNITVIDIAPILVENLQEKFSNKSNIKIILGDFFEHHGTYDLIIEQTFFCALLPTMRQKYVYKMHQLLQTNGKLIGLLFNRTFEKSPPFGGSANEYENLFQQAFHFTTLVNCNNSVTPRANSEIFIDFVKNNDVVVTLYKFVGITCNGCMNTVTQKFKAISNTLNVSMSSNYAEVLIVSKTEININVLKNEIAYDANYSIEKITQ